MLVAETVRHLVLTSLAEELGHPGSNVLAETIRPLVLIRLSEDLEEPVHSNSNNVALVGGVSATTK